MGLRKHCRKYCQILLLAYVLLLGSQVHAMDPDSLINIAYGKAPGADGKMRTLTMDLFFPRVEAGKKLPLIMLMHGGGFISGTKEAMKAHCRLLADSGFIAVSINYRKGWDNGGNAYSCNGNVLSLQQASYRATQDARAAIRFLVEKQEQFAIDTSWIFVGGSSAGAVIALNLAYLTDSVVKQTAPELIKQLGDLNSSTNSYKHSFRLKGICSMWGGLSDSAMINRGNALPTIFFHGTDDMVVPYDAGRYGTICNNYPMIFGSACLYRRTISAGKPAVLNAAEGEGHGPKKYWHRVTMIGAVVFFRKVMQKE